MQVCSTGRLIRWKSKTGLETGLVPVMVMPRFKPCGLGEIGLGAGDGEP